MSRFKWEIHVTQEGDSFRATLFADRCHHRCAIGRSREKAVRALLDVLDTPIDPNDPLMALVDRSSEALRYDDRPIADDDGDDPDLIQDRLPQ